MPELDFKVTGVSVEPFAAVPTLLFDLRIASDVPLRNIALRCQIRIEPTRRNYTSDEHEPLAELFGEKRRWGQTLHSFLWDHVNLQIPAFEGETTVKLPLVCTHDFNVGATKYFHGLQGGSAPLSFLFSGAIFYDDADGHLQIGQVSWRGEAAFGLPVETWRALMTQYYPETTWLRVPNALFERLYRYRRDKGFVDWNQTLDSLIPQSELERMP